MSLPTSSDVKRGPWTRQVVTTVKQGDNEMTVHTSETLVMGDAVLRLHEVRRKRPDASVRDWLDVALNGWGDD